MCFPVINFHYAVNVHWNPNNATSRQQEPRRDSFSPNGHSSPTQDTQGTLGDASQAPHVKELPPRPQQVARCSCHCPSDPTAGHLLSPLLGTPSPDPILWSNSFKNQIKCPLCRGPLRTQQKPHQACPPCLRLSSLPPPDLLISHSPKPTWGLAHSGCSVHSFCREKHAPTFLTTPSLIDQALA